MFGGRDSARLTGCAVTDQHDVGGAERVEYPAESCRLAERSVDVAYPESACVAAAQRYEPLPGRCHTDREALGRPVRVAKRDVSTERRIGPGGPSRGSDRDVNDHPGGSSDEVGHIDGVDQLPCRDVRNLDNVEVRRGACGWHDAPVGAGPSGHERIEPGSNPTVPDQVSGAGSQRAFTLERGGQNVERQRGVTRPPEPDLIGSQGEDGIDAGWREPGE